MGNLINKIIVYPTFDKENSVTDVTKRSSSHIPQVAVKSVRSGSKRSVTSSNERFTSITNLDQTSSRHKLLSKDDVTQQSPEIQNGHSPNKVASIWIQKRSKDKSLNTVKSPTRTPSHRKLSSLLQQLQPLLLEMDQVMDYQVNLSSSSAVFKPRPHFTSASIDKYIELVKECVVTLRVKATEEDMSSEDTLMIRGALQRCFQYLQAGAHVEQGDEGRETLGERTASSVAFTTEASRSFTATEAKSVTSKESSPFTSTVSQPVTSKESLPFTSTVSVPSTAKEHTVLSSKESFPFTSTVSQPVTSKESLPFTSTMSEPFTTRESKSSTSTVSSTFPAKEASKERFKHSKEAVKKTAKKTSNERKRSNFLFLHFRKYKNTVRDKSKKAVQFANKESTESSESSESIESSESSYLSESSDWSRKKKIRSMAAYSLIPKSSSAFEASQDGYANVDSKTELVQQRTRDTKKYVTVSNMKSDEQVRGLRHHDASPVRKQSVDEDEEERVVKSDGGVERRFSIDSLELEPVRTRSMEEFLRMMEEEEARTAAKEDEGCWDKIFKFFRLFVPKKNKTADKSPSRRASIYEEPTAVVSRVKKDRPTSFPDGASPADIGFILRRGWGGFRADALSLNGQVCFREYWDMGKDGPLIKYSERNSTDQFLKDMGFAPRSTKNTKLLEQLTKDDDEDDDDYGLTKARRLALTSRSERAFEARMQAAINEARMWTCDRGLSQKKAQLLYFMATLERNIAKFYLLLVEAVVNNRITTITQLEGIINTMELVADGVILEEELMGLSFGQERSRMQDKVGLNEGQAMLLRTFRIMAAQEADEAKTAVPKTAMELLPILALQYKNGIDKYFPMLVKYMAQGHLTTSVQLEDAITYLTSDQVKHELNYHDFEIFVGLTHDKVVGNSADFWLVVPRVARAFKHQKPEHEKI